MFKRVRRVSFHYSLVFGKQKEEYQPFNERCTENSSGSRSDTLKTERRTIIRTTAFSRESPIFRIALVPLRQFCHVLFMQFLSSQLFAKVSYLLIHIMRQRNLVIYIYKSEEK